MASECRRLSLTRRGDWMSRTGEAARGFPALARGHTSDRKLPSDDSRQEARGELTIGNHASGFPAEDGIAIARDTVVEPIGKAPRQERPDPQERPGIGHEAA